MSTFNGHVVSEAVQDVDASETTAALTTGATLIPLAAADDFHEGSYCRIDGEVYHYDDELTDDGEESGVPSVTIDAPGLLADVAEGTAVESWNPNAKGGIGDVNCDWKVQVAPDADSETDGHPATLSESLVPTTSTDMPLMVGDAVLVEALDDGSWLVLNKLGGTPGIDPAYFRTGTIQADTEITVGDPDGKRVVIKGDPAIQAYDASNVQTVNIDGEQNFMQGSIATDAPGEPRVEVGKGNAATFPVQPALETRYYTESVDEIEPAMVTAHAETSLDDPALTIGSIELTGPVWTDGPTPPSLKLTAAYDSVIVGPFPSRATLQADGVVVEATFALISGVLYATMADGSVGTGTFRDSVDARVVATTRLFAGTTATGGGTAAKTATITGFTPAAGDTLALTLTNGNSAASPTLNINSGGAKAIRLGGVAVGTVFGTSAAGAIWALRYDGTVWHLAGAQQPNTDLVAIGSLSPSNDDVLQRKAGAWTNRTMAQVKTDLALVKGDVGLGNVDNTSDATKNAAAVTLTNKTLTSPVINTPTGIVKGDVGLGNVDNTADTAKPVSTAQQTALDAKVAGPASSVSGNLVSFSGTTGKIAQDTGVAVSTDGTLASNSDAKTPTEKATKTYADTKQPLDATLTALAGVTTAADKLIYATGSDAFATTDLSSFMRTVLDDTTAAAARTTLDAQQLDATLTALAGVTTAANKLIYATGSDAFSTVDFTALAQSLSAISTVAAFRAAILAKDKRPGVNTQTANYQIASTDEDVRVQVNSATAKTITLPSDTTDPAVPTNMECSVTRLGAGTVTFVADTGVTIDSRGALLGINGQYGVVNIKKRASNRWIIWGDLV